MILWALLALFVKSTLAQLQIYNFRCGSAGEGTSAANTTAQSFSKGSSMYLCIHFAPFGIRIPFSLVVDDYNMIEVSKGEE